jgi:mono-ADP-ribosyltransferase sirtuin 6
MSAGYASRLSDYPHKGVVGLPESFDTRRSVTVKVRRLAVLVQQSSYFVILTGAGISTSARIPDFRGPNGIWTIEKKRKNQTKYKQPPQERQQQLGNHEVVVVEKTLQSSKGSRKRSQPTRPDITHSVTLSTTTSLKRPTHSTPSSKEEDDANNNLTNFSNAQPTITHRAITKLANTGKLKYCITQNVDGLHRRSGLSRKYHSTVHGCVFTEKCSHCGYEYFGDVDVGGLSFQPTGNTCMDCKSPLHDILLDWNDPVIDMDRIERECEQADLVLCLGTSLRIEPVGRVPLLALQYVIVNLQPTPRDDDATLVIRARVDDVMDELMVLLGYNDWKDEPMPAIERRWKDMEAPAVGEDKSRKQLIKNEK